MISSLFAQVPGIPGKIAYFKNQTELHITEADGNNNQVIWTNPVPVSPFFPALSTGDRTGRNWHSPVVTEARYILMIFGNQNRTVAICGE
ncbi:MAG: hypothetical protein R3C26_09910 [Calditrichia bacterium]